MAETPSTTHDAIVTLLRALVEELKGCAHDPALVHAAALKLHAGVDALEKMLTDKNK